MSGETMEELRAKLVVFEELIREVQQAGLLSGALDGKYLRLSLDMEWFDDARMAVGDENETLKITLQKSAGANSNDELREKLAAAITELERLGRCNEQLSSSHAEQINHQNQRLAAAEAKKMLNTCEACGDQKEELDDWSVCYKCRYDQTVRKLSQPGDDDNES